MVQAWQACRHRVVAALEGSVCYVTIKVIFWRKKLTGGLSGLRIWDLRTLKAMIVMGIREMAVLELG